VKKDNYSKWTTKQLHRQIRNLILATGLLVGILLVLFSLTIYKSLEEGQINFLLISPIVLSLVVPLNIKRIREIKGEIQRRDLEN